MEKLLWWTERMKREDMPRIKVNDYHDLIKVTEVASIIECAEMAARASLARTESRWGLGHYRLKFPKREASWENKWVVIKKNAEGEMKTFSKEVPPHKWSFPVRLDYEYPEMHHDIGKGYVHPPNDNRDAWIAEKFKREGYDVPPRMVPRKKER
jgi:hypothetical protein